MTSLLAKQVAAFKQQHGITAVGAKRHTAPSILFSPQEAKTHDPESFAALALHGLSEASILEPKLSQFSELFEGSMRDRDLLTKEENGVLDQKIRNFLLLLSPHLQARAAQECVEGLLQRYHAHRWNVDDIMAAALPHHDSPLFTKLIQGLHVENRPRWAWLATLKAKPATLIRSTLAKYCSKDTAVLAFVGDVLEETLQLQLQNRALMTFFVAIWLDTIALSVGNDLVQVAIQSILKLLTQPAQQDAFYAGVTVAGALCAKIQLEESVQGQLLVRLAKQAVGEDGRAAFSLMAEMAQLQELEKLPHGVVKVLAKRGPEELLSAPSSSVDAGNLLAMLVKAALLADEENAQALAEGILQDGKLLRCYAPQLCRAVLQAFLECLSAAGTTAKARKKILARFQASAKCLGLSAPVALGEAMRQQLATLEKEAAEMLVQLLAPACATISEGEDRFMPAVQAFSHKSAKVRSKAIISAAASLEETEGAERQQLLASMALHTVEDEHVEVVATALRQQALWVSDKVAPAAAVSTLVMALTRLVKNPKQQKSKSLFHGLFLEDAKAKKLLPLVIQAAAWVQSRKDLPQELQQRLEVKLLPLLLVALLGLDEVTEDGSKDLQPAVLAFCEVSQEQLFQQVSVDTESSGSLGPLGSSVLQAADAAGALRLCDLVAGRCEEVPVLGGVASQAAAGRLLSAALPSLVETLKSARPKAIDLLMRSVEACERFAESLSDDWSLLKGLWKATLEAAAALCSAAPRRKSRGGTASAPGDNREAIQRLMRLALRKPKDLAADLQVVLTQESFRPALIALALGPTEKGVASANAMLMLKSLVVKKGWHLDQNLLALIMAKIAGAQELEVRAAAVAFLKVLKDSPTDDTLDATLVEANLLRAKSAVLPDKAWTSITSELSKDLWSSTVDLLLKNEKEMLQDRSAAVLAMSKLWSKGGLPKSQRQEVIGFTMVSLARCEDEAVDLLLPALPASSALQSAKEALGKAISEFSKKVVPNQAFSLLALAMKVMTQGSEKSKAAQEAILDTARSVIFPLCLALAKSCENEVPCWDHSMVNLATATCRAVSRLAFSSPEAAGEATNCLFRLAVSLRGLAPKMSETTNIASVVAAASSSLAEVPSDAEILQSLLKSEPLQGKRLKEPQGEAAAQLIYEQVLALPAGQRSKLLVALANTAKEAGKHVPKDSDAKGGAVVHLLMAVAALSEQMAKDVEDSEATEVAAAVPSVCEAIDEATTSCLEPCLTSLIRCCGALTMLAAEDSALKLVEKSLSKVKLHLRPDALALLKGNIKKLWRYPEAEDWKMPQARLRGLLHHTFKVIEVSKLHALALANSGGTRLGLDFSILLLLVHRSRQEKPSLPKKKRRKKRADPINEELDEVVEALTAPSDEDLLLDEVYEMLTSPEPSDRYHVFGMLLLSLAAWSAKMRSCQVPWAALLPDEVMSELDEDACFRTLRQGIQLASRFLSEHGLPDQLDMEEVDTSVLLEMYEEKEGDIALALIHGLRALCIIEALLTQTPGQGREEVQCRKQTQDLQGLMLRSLSVNHPVTFFRGLCLSLGVKGHAPKGNASTLLADQDFVSHLSSRVMSAAAKALSDRRDLRPDEEMEGEEGGAENCEAAIQHVCKRFLSGGDHDEMATAWELLDEICRFSQQHASGSILTSALPKAGAFLGALEEPDTSATKAAVKCCQCVETMVRTLGHGILPGLKEICHPLLDLALQATGSSFEDLDASVLRALAALCRSVGAMLSPFLGKFLQVVCAPAAVARTQLLQSLGSDLIEGVPHRLLLKEVQKSTVDPFKEGSMDSDEAMIRSQRLSTFYLWILLKATPEFVAAQDLMPAILRLFGCSSSSVKSFLATGADAQEIPIRLLKRGTSTSFITSAAIQDLSWSNVAQDASLQTLQMLGGACFARFCLFLEPDDVKTRISKVLDWARGKQDKLLAKPKTEVKDEDASKALALLASLSTLAAEAEGLGEELLMPLANKDVASALKAAQSTALRMAREKLPRKKRRTASGPRSEKEVLTSHSWWWYDVALACLNFLALVFRQGSKSGAESKIWEESFEELMEPSVAILDLFEFLTPESAICGGLARALQPALVAMTSASAEDGVKRMMQAILEKTRSEDGEVTLMAVKCAHRIWSELGVQVVMSLSEVVMYTSELQDHEDSRVEAEVKALVRTIEECTGESLHDAMKT